ncbi:hypothetical protein CQ12_37465 [Bradyrhizobium jicamae]|uniref:Uncharacterized protein n=1 Tax=Bradyrhizobium jicamae TaxID=280332 RepID=A0A0R3KPX0_9BRAD|nr:hypothetical protein CQ12_37465 [Bradyrhizobium jicamae]
METVRNAITESVLRLEVSRISDGVERWSSEDKARIVGEIVASGDSVCVAAPPQGLSLQQMFGWHN